MTTYICAWCGKFLSQSNDGQDQTSHGICEGCKAKQLAELEKAKANNKKK